MDKYIGRMLDNRYEILEVIGSGGMAVVYKARCHRLNRLVAIKILKDDNLEDEDFRRRFHAESQTVATLSHPNIVSVFDVSSSIMADYIVMELIEGISLKQYMEKKGTLNWKETLHFAIQIAKALEHAHSRGIVHRDIKPHNVMVLKNGSVKVTDFGIARMMSKGNTLTKEALGSVHYISPEQAKGGRVDSRSDIYSLGVVMYEMMTGRPPYDGDSPVAVAIKHINGGALMPSLLNPNIPGGLEQIIMKAMTHEIEDRYESATKMLSDMDEFRKDPTILFDYNTPPLDIVTRITRNPATEQQPQTTAQRVEEAATAPKRRTPPPPERRTPTSSQRRRQIEEKSNRTATIAIIACSLAAVMAIVIFLVILLGGSGSSRENLVEVPNLMGYAYENLPEYENFKIISDTVYDEDDPAGVILKQQPDAGDMVVPGTKIVVTVSLGPAPKTITMSQLAGLPQVQAEKILTDLGLDLKFVIEEVFSEDVSKGNVIRTEPAQGEELTTGQTVTLWISAGEEIKTGAMPGLEGATAEEAQKTLEKQKLKLKVTVEELYDSNVEAGLVISTKPEKGEALETGMEVILYVSKGPQLAKMPNVVGMNIDTAITVLKAAGFQTPDIMLVASNEAEDTVVSQSVEKNTDIDITTQIMLEVSKGPEETEQEQTEPTQTTKDVEIFLPEDYITSADYTVEFKQSGKTVKSVTVAAGSSSVVVSLTGSGKQYYEIWIGDQLYRTQEVDFTTNG